VKTSYLLVFFLISINVCFGQKKPKKQTANTTQNIELVAQLIDQNQVQKALEILYKNIGKEEFKEGLAYYYLMLCHYDLRNRDSIAYYAKKTIPLLANKNKPRLLANTYYYLSYAQLILGYYEESLQNIQTATTQFINLKDSTGLIKSYHWNSIIYHDTKEYLLGIEYGLKAVDLANKYKSENADLKAKALNAIAINYDDNGDYEMAIAYHQKVIGLKDELSDSLKLAPTYNNIGNSLMKKGDFNTAKKFFLKNKEISELEQSKYGLATVYTNLGTVAYLGKNWKEAEGYLKAAEKISFEIKDVEKIQDVLFQQYKFNEATNNLPKALSYLSSYHQLKDSLLSIDKINALQELETHFKTKEKEAEIDQQQLIITNQSLRLQKNTLLIIALIILVLLILLIGFFIKNRLQRKQQLAIQQREIGFKEAQLTSIISTQEKERARFSSDLHDSFGQTISILKMNIKTAQKEVKSSAKSDSIFEESDHMLNSMYDELRAVCANLMPITLQKSGLIEALTEFAQRVNKSGQIKLTVSNFGLTSRIKGLQEIAVYRIVQEWVNNILKYSTARNITVQITAEESEITITIEDDGNGFNKTLLTESKGNGWNNINSRIKLLGGTVDVDTTPNRIGTILILNFPPQFIS